MRHKCISKHHSTRGNQAVLLMITDCERQHFLKKKFPTLLKGIISHHNGDSYYLNCLHSFSTENKPKEHKNVCKNHDYCCIKRAKKVKDLLSYKDGEKFVKVQFIIYADMESLLQKVDVCCSNPKNSSTTKIKKHTASGYLLFMHCSFEATKNRHNYYGGKDCMEKFSENF